MGVFTNADEKPPPPLPSPPHSSRLHHLFFLSPSVSVSPFPALSLDWFNWAVSTVSLSAAADVVHTGAELGAGPFSTGPWTTLHVWLIVWPVWGVVVVVGGGTQVAEDCCFSVWEVFANRFYVFTCDEKCDAAGENSCVALGELPAVWDNHPGTCRQAYLSVDLDFLTVKIYGLLLS